MTDRKRTVVSFREKKSVRTQASEWLAKLDGDAPSKEDLTAFRRWVREDPLHHEEFERLIATWDDLNVLTQLLAYKQPKPAYALVPSMSLSWKAVATGLAVLAMVSIGIAFDASRSAPTTYATAIGEQQVLTLADGSEVTLNTTSAIRVEYNEARRLVELVYGEAHFDVQQDPARPFEVRAGEGLVRAVGTAFSVRRRQQAVEVLVTEGTVEVDPGLPAAGGSAHAVTDPVAGQRLVRLEAGKRATFEDFKITNIQRVDVSEVEKHLAWRSGMLHYEGEELENVVADVSRYTRIRIIIPESAARQLRVGGYFKVGEVQALFEALEEGFGIHVEYVSDDLVYLTYPAKGTPASN